MLAGRRLHHAFILVAIGAATVLVSLLGHAESIAPGSSDLTDVRAEPAAEIGSAAHADRHETTVLLAATGSPDPAPFDLDHAQRLERVVVADTDGQGANLRASPGRAGAVLRVVAEGESLAVIGQQRTVDGMRWRPVRDGAGQHGWVAASLLRPATPPIAVETRPGSASAAPTDPAPGQMIDSRLMAAWRSLVALDQLGPTFGEILARSSARVTVGPLPNSIYGAYRPRQNSVTISQAALAEDPRAVAAVLAHELTHARQTFEGRGRGSDDCVAMEVEAFQVAAQVWDAFWPDSTPDRTPLERGLNSVTRRWLTEGEAGLRGFVLETPGYQHQCGI